MLGLSDPASTDQAVIRIETQPLYNQPYGGVDESYLRADHVFDILELQNGLHRDGLLQEPVPFIHCKKSEGM